MIPTKRKIEICSKLGQELISQMEAQKLDNLFVKVNAKNPWFTKDSIMRSLTSICDKYLNEDALTNLKDKYKLNAIGIRKNIGLVMPGNIPAVGFHDVLSVFLCNHISLIKYSSKDDVLIPYMLEELAKIDQETKDYFVSVERLKGHDAVIATGGNNTSRYFEFYFKDIPHIIRKSRSSVAVLTGNETDNEILALGDDIFSYFGLGCRNVSKLFIPEGYDLVHLLDLLHRFNEINLHHKYRNNFDYNTALFLLNKEPFLNNGSIILKEDVLIASRIACLHYEYYDNIQSLINHLNKHKEEIQCIVSTLPIDGFQLVYFGEAQSPGIMDYSDGIDTVQFLLTL